MKKRPKLNIMFITNDKINKDVENVIIESIACNIIKLINDDKKSTDIE